MMIPKNINNKNYIKSKMTNIQIVFQKIINWKKNNKFISINLFMKTLPLSIIFKYRTHKKEVKQKFFRYLSFT